MEKLQNALKKARQQRQMGGANSDMPNLATRKKRELSRIIPVDNMLANTWAVLKSFEPDAKHLLSNRIMTLNAQSKANSFDILRTKVYLLMRQNGWKRLAITSPTTSCGKTTTACNMAVGFSRQLEMKSMLFDMDLRRPNVAKMMGARPEHDIEALMTGRRSPNEQLLRLRTNVALSMANRSVEDPTQILLSQTTTNIIEEIETEYKPDIMIFDLPPLLSTDDTRAFLKNVDCALIVARSEQTKVVQLDICEREASEHTNVLGVVLNNCRHIDESQEQYYGEKH